MASCSHCAAVCDGTGRPARVCAIARLNSHAGRSGPDTRISRAVAHAAGHRQDVLPMDVRLPGLTRLEAAERVRAATPTTRVIIPSTHTGEEHVTRALKAGAAGYVLKDAQPDELERAVRQVARG